MNRRQYRVASTGKYYNRRAEIDGYVFPSQAEAARYLVLKAEQQAGTIDTLEVHPSFVLQPAFTDWKGKHHRAITFEADFSYYDPAVGPMIVEDTKGYKTKDFRIKEKLFLYKFRSQYDLRIVEV